jgi:holo-[acyl-carrier protein] synthase
VTNIAGIMFRAYIRGVRVGIDLVRIKRIDEILERNPRSLEKILNPSELNGKVESIAAKIAVKEAVMKCVDGLTIGNFLDILVTNNTQGKPLAQLQLGGLEEMEIKVSVSHDGEYVVAVAIIPS